MTTPAPKTRLKKLAGFVLVLYWLALVAGTHVPRPPQAIFPRGVSDKWLHLAAYAGLAFLLCVNWSLRRSWGWRHCAMLVVVLAAFGAIDEVTQIPVGRECDALDWMADVIGSCTGLVVFLAAWATERWLAGTRRQPHGG